MKFRYLIFLLLLASNFNCKFHSCSNEMDEIVEFYDKNYRFNYYAFSDEFFEYLISNGIIQNYSKEEVIALFKDKLYCNINYEDYNLNVNHWLATGPGFGGAMIELSNTQNNCSIPPISLDYINNDSSQQYLANVVKSLEKDQFDDRFSKAFFTYTINIIFHQCR